MNRLPSCILFCKPVRLRGRYSVTALVIAVLVLCALPFAVLCCAGKPESKTGRTRILQGWDFSDPSDYSYDPRLVDITGDAARSRRLPLDEGWWTSTYDGGGASMAYGVACDTGGNPVVTGVIQPGPDNDIWTGKFRGKDGATVWTKTHASGHGSDKSRGVCIDPEGNPVVAGHVDTGTSFDSWVRKLKGRDGVTVWTSTYDAGNRDDYSVGLVSGPGGDLYACGYTIETANYDVWVRKFDGEKGAPVWTRTYDGGFGSDFGYGLSLGADGNIFITGFMFNGRDNDILVAKLSSANGDLFWERLLEHPGNDMAFAVSTGIDGHPVVAGTISSGSGQDIWAGKFNSDSGETMWVETLGDPRADDYAYGVSCGPDGNPVAVGYREKDSEEGVWVGKLDGRDGSVLWESAFRAPGGGIAYCVSCDTRGNPFVAGYVRDGRGSLVWVRKYPPGKYALSPPVTTKRASNVEGRNLAGFVEYTGGKGGKATYQLSPDGKVFYYYDGDAWVEAGDSAARSNTANDVNEAIKDFNGIAASALYVRVFLNSDSVERAELEGIRVDTAPQ